MQPVGVRCGAAAARAFGLAVKLTGRRSAGEDRLVALMAVLGRKAVCVVLVNPDMIELAD